MDNSLLFIETSLFAIGFFCTIVSTCVLLSSKDGRSPANRFLVYFLVSMSLVLFMTFMILTKFIVHVPWLYRLPSPLYYFLFPSAYIYMRMVLIDEPKARKNDWLHAIPAMVHLVEMMPYYLRPTELKLAHILSDSVNPLGPMMHSEGWLPGYMHNLLRGLQGVIYAILIMIMLWKSVKKRSLGAFIFPQMMRWLWVFSGMILLFSMAIVLTFTFPDIPIATRSVFLYAMMAGTQIVAGIFLFLNPSILFGMPKLEKMVVKLRLLRAEKLMEKPCSNISETHFMHSPVFDTQVVQSLMASSLNTHEVLYTGTSNAEPATAYEVENHAQKLPQYKYEEYIALLGRLMEEKKPFLRKRYSISDLSNDVKVPQHHISYLINNIFNIRFNDYINQFRIQYIKNRLATEDLNHLTLEGLALEAGFTSRITFIRVVQKQTGMNPSEYFKTEQIENEEVINTVSIGEGGLSIV